MKRKEVVELYPVLRELKNGSMSKQALTAFILMRVKLKARYDEFEKVRQQISEETKPADYKDGDSMEKWNEAYAPIMEKWLKEEITEEINTNVLSPEDFVDLVSNTEMTGGVQDLLFEKLVKNC